MAARDQVPTIAIPARWLGILLGFITGQAITILILAVVLVRLTGRCGL